MQWQDDAVVLAVRRHGETSAIVDLMTQSHGRHSGLVRGASSRVLRPILQIGNHVQATWRGRLDEHLGHYRLEAKALRASQWMSQVHCLFALQILTSHTRLLAPREDSPRIYDALNHVLNQQGSIERIGECVVRFELLLLEELGFGLDLRTCASTGESDDLVYVSPRSGHAVSRRASEPYVDRLLPLPSFLHTEEGLSDIEVNDICDAMILTGFFLTHRVYSPRNLIFPSQRESLYNLLKGMKE